MVDLWGASLIPANDPVAAANHLESGEPPLFIIHGSNDPTVPFSASELLVARAQSQRLAHEFHPVPGGGHGFGVGGADIFNVEASWGYALRSACWSGPYAPSAASARSPSTTAWSALVRNPATSGQGYFFDIDPVTQTLAVAWFVYDTAAGGSGGTLAGAEQRWFTAQGRYLGNRADLTVYQSRFGQFNNPIPVTTTPVGNLSVEFIDCGRATLTFNLSAFGLTGSVPIVRLLPDVVCQAIADGDLQIPTLPTSAGAAE
ncbi:MAG: prolyl oligopeptidase family serine peptidase [Rhodanobacteraceae bacterium]|nr:prolyl oligopeptidase family serine peptidase [Rhodanobacteraceae bacterium]